MTADEVSALDKWYLIDAADQVLGRVATKVATILSGKHRPHYAPFLVTGDHVVIINADKIKLTGQKLDQKVYRHHTLYPGGLQRDRGAQGFGYEARESDSRSRHRHASKEQTAQTDGETFEGLCGGSTSARGSAARSADRIGQRTIR